MKVMYMCTRLQKSTGYPVATHHLRQWLFAANFEAADIAECLEAIYYHAIDRWVKAQDAWINSSQTPIKTLWRRSWKRKDAVGSPSKALV
jgi:hypothetical protein